MFIDAGDADEQCIQIKPTIRGGMRDIEGNDAASERFGDYMHGVGDERTQMHTIVIPFAAFAETNMRFAIYGQNKEVGPGLVAGAAGVDCGFNRRS